MKKETILLKNSARRYLWEDIFMKATNIEY